MKLNQILKETRTKLKFDNNEVYYLLKNPTYQELLNFTTQLGYKNSRGVVIDGNTYWFDAELFIHSDIVYAYNQNYNTNFDYKKCFGVVFKERQPKNILKIYDIKETILDFPSLYRTFFGTDILIDIHDTYIPFSEYCKNNKKINESIEKILLPYDNKNILIYKNPIGNNLLLFCDNSRYKDIRGLIYKNNTYWWDSNVALHGDVANALGIVEYFDYRLILKSMMDGYYIIDYDEKCHDELFNNKCFKSSLKTDKILFHVYGKGLVNYRQQYLEEYKNH